MSGVTRRKKRLSPRAGKVASRGSSRTTRRVRTPPKKQRQEPKKPSPPKRPKKQHLGCISKFEKTNLKTTRTKSATTSEHYKVFQFFDTDSSGSIDVSELDGVFKALQIKLSTKDTLLLFDTLDADHDGVLSFPEF